MERKVIVLALISWAGMRWLLARSVRARETTLRRLSDLGGNPLQLLKDGLGPPYRLLVLLLVELAVVAFLQGVGPRSAEGGGGGAVIILLLLGPFVALCLFEQLLAWESRGPQRRGWARASSFLIVWLPLLLYSILGSLGRSFPGFPGEGLWYLALISPFSQMALLGGISTTEVQGSAAIGVAIPQGAALVAVVSLSLLHMRILRAFGSSARKLRAATMATTTEKEAAAEGERGEGARFASDSTAAERGDA